MRKRIAPAVRPSAMVSNVTCSPKRLHRPRGKRRRSLLTGRPLRSRCRLRRPSRLPWRQPRRPRGRPRGTCRRPPHRRSRPWWSRRWPPARRCPWQSRRRPRPFRRRRSLKLVRLHRVRLRPFRPMWYRPLRLPRPVRPPPDRPRRLRRVIPRRTVRGSSRRVPGPAAQRQATAPRPFRQCQLRLVRRAFRLPQHQRPLRLRLLRRRPMPHRRLRRLVRRLRQHRQHHQHRVRRARPQGPVVARVA